MIFAVSNRASAIAIKPTATEFSKENVELLQTRFEWWNSYSVVAIKPAAMEFAKEHVELFTSKIQMMTLNLNWYLDDFTIWKKILTKYFEQILACVNFLLRIFY